MHASFSAIQKTHTKKYTIFSCNKMAESDRRPFTLTLAA